MLPSYEPPLRFQEGWFSLKPHSRTPRNPPRGLTLQMGMLGNLKARTALRMCSKNLQLAPNCGTWVSYDESTWVLTSYLVSNAVVLPLSAWLSRVFGRKRYYMLCVVLFTLSSLLCGLAPSLGLLIFFRVLQGVGGGGLAPVEQAILVDTFPPQKRPAAFALYSMAIVTAPVIGPPLGGWITNNWSWRGSFLINIPIGLVF